MKEVEQEEDTQRKGAIINCIFVSVLSPWFACSVMGWCCRYVANSSGNEIDGVLRACQHGIIGRFCIPCFVPTRRKEEREPSNGTRPSWPCEKCRGLWFLVAAV